MRVLVVKMSALGDVVHALPVLEYLHAAVPGIEVDWVVESAFKDVLTGNSLVSQLHLVETKRWRQDPWSRQTRQEVGAAVAALRARHFDLAFDIQGNIKSGVIAFLSGAKRRYGFARDGVREWPNLMMTTDRVPLRPLDHHVTDRSLRVVSAAFGSEYFAPAATIVTSAADDAEVRQLVAAHQGRIFLFHHGTTWETKLWHEAGWVHLGKEVLAAYPGAVVFLSWGNDKERETAEAIAAAIGTGAVVLPRLSLKTFTALLKIVDLVVGGDTGPIHMAAAVGTPTVSFFRATDGTRNGPRGPAHRVVQSPLSCTVCLRKRCERDTACRESISPAAIMAEVSALVAGPAGTMTERTWRG